MPKTYKTFRTIPAANGQVRWAVQHLDGLVLGYIAKSHDGYFAWTVNLPHMVKAVGISKLQEAATWIFHQHPEL